MATTTEAPDGRPMPCVIMRIPSDHIATEGRRLLDDARAWTRLVHPNVVRVLEVGETEGDAFIAVELVDGCDLGTVWRRCFERGVSLPVESAVFIASRLAAALAYIHSFEDLRLTHRAISPGNVLLSFEGDVRLTNFGLTPSTLNTHDADISATFGTGSHLSPEQAEGRRLDVRTDIYCLGIVLWELLAGRPLFVQSKGNGWDRGAIRPPSEFDHRVPRSLDKIVMKALAVKREKRYQSAATLLADLDAAIPNRPTVDALRDFLGGIFGDTPTSVGANEASDGSRSPAVSGEPGAEIPQRRQAERTVPTNPIKRFLSRLSSRWRQYGRAIVALMVVEVAAGALFFRSSSMVGKRSGGRARPTSPTVLTAPTAPTVLTAPTAPTVLNVLIAPAAPPVSSTGSAGPHLPEPLGVTSPSAAERLPAEPSPPRGEVTLARLPETIEIRAPQQPARRPARPAVAPKAASVTPPPTTSSVTPPPATSRVTPAPATAAADPGGVPVTVPAAAAAPKTSGSLDRVPEEIVQATDLTSRAEEAFRAGLPLDAVRLARKSLGSGGGARARMVLAEAYFDLKLFQEALDAYSDVLAEQPENQAARVGRDLAGAEVSRSREGGRAASESTRRD